MTNMRRERGLQTVQVFVPFREHERRAAGAHGIDHVAADTPVTRVIVYQRLIERLKLEALVRLGCPPCLKCRGLYEHHVFERTDCGLSFRVHSVANSPHCMRMIG
jgi:hypothetical protein